MILSVERDYALGPLKVRGRGCGDCANLSEFSLPLTRSEASRTSAKDQETVLDFGKTLPLRVVVLGGFFGALLRDEVGVIPMQDCALVDAKRVCKHKGLIPDSNVKACQPI